MAAQIETFMRKMRWLIYIQSPLRLAIAALLLLVSWAFMGRKFPVLWHWINRLLFFGAVAGILFATVIGRNTIASPIVFPVPFSKWIRAREQKELYREMFMNALLFVPLGATLPYLFPVDSKKRTRILITVLTALVCSVVLETLQYRLQIGLFEADDILSNTIGAFVGVLHIVLADLWRDVRGRKK